MVFLTSSREMVSYESFLYFVVDAFFVSSVSYLDENLTIIRWESFCEKNLQLYIYLQENSLH